jgi:hypothetical protein
MYSTSGWILLSVVMDLSMLATIAVGMDGRSMVYILVARVQNMLMYTTSLAMILTSVSSHLCVYIQHGIGGVVALRCNHEYRVVAHV